MSVNSIDKMIEYIGKVSKEPIKVNDKILFDKPVESVTISDKFFRKSGCHMCGRCCPNENNAYTITDIKRIANTDIIDFDKWGLKYEGKEKLLKGIETIPYVINDKVVIMYSHPKDKPKEAQTVTYEDRGTIQRCHWLFEDENGLHKCRIHPIRSVTCGLPHLQFRHNKRTNRTNLIVMQFGRNWALGCPVILEDGIDEETIQDKIKWLNILNNNADDIGIKTYLPEIIDYLESGNRKPATFKNKGGRLFETRV